jgi:lycopene beta-cyclase
LPLSSKYDFIFIGAGCGALSIVMRMIKSGKFSDKKILLIDKEPKIKNDRTWCFWEEENGFFENVVYKKWSRLSFFSDEYSNTMDISPFEYKMIRGIDFYNYCFSKIVIHKNIDILYREVKSFSCNKGGITLHLNNEVLEFGYVTIFNSFFGQNDRENTNSKNNITLLQHFKGWIINTPNAAFDPAIATFMDFRVQQDRGTTFTYVLPLSETKALVEYTLFTKEILKDEEYESELKAYLKDFLRIDDYKIIEQEFGVIPMGTKKLDFYTGGIYNIGTVGGQTKASTGYTFQFIQKQATLITECLIHNKSLSEIPVTSSRFLFYDKVLLDVLYNKSVTGKEIFTTLFKKNKPQQVLKFLDNESSLTEELKIIFTLPTLPFLKAALRQF